MKDFLFGPEQARTPIEKLSGGERGRLMLARALSLAVEPDRARRADQRPRRRDARPAAGAARRLQGHDSDRQPRPRFSRPRRDLGDRQRRRRALGRIRRRLLRHGRAARLWPPGSSARARREAREAGGQAEGRAAAKRKLSFNEKRALEPPAEAHGRAARRDRRARSELGDADFAAHDASHRSTSRRGSCRRSTRARRRSPTRGASSRRRRCSGFRNSSPSKPEGLGPTVPELAADETASSSR